MDWVKAVKSVPRQPYRGSELVKEERHRSELKKACVEAHEAISAAIQRSTYMVCGVCLEVVFKKDNPGERRFGILPNCNHCYCLDCIRMWRSIKGVDGKKIKSCPLCRTRSGFFIPSAYWVEDAHEKQQMINKYKDGMARKPCQYFDEGRGTCHFGSTCFYKHERRDGAQPQTGQPLRLPRGRDVTDPSYTEEDIIYTFDLEEMLLNLFADRPED